MTDNMIWVDIETTGLSPTLDRILEVGILVTDAELEPLSSAAWLIGPAPNLASIHPDVIAMHSHSSLFEDVARRGESMEITQKAIVTWLREHAAAGLAMCGSSVHFDRAFLAALIPQVHDYFGYRNVDVSTIKELFNRWQPAIVENRPKANAEHRALPDIDDSIKELAYYRKWMKA